MLCLVLAGVWLFETTKFDELLVNNNPKAALRVLVGSSIESIARRLGSTAPVFAILVTPDSNFALIASASTDVEDALLLYNVEVVAAALASARASAPGAADPLSPPFIKIVLNSAWGPFVSAAWNMDSSCVVCAFARGSVVVFDTQGRVLATHNSTIPNPVGTSYWYCIRVVIRHCAVRLSCSGMDYVRLRV